jgi:signal transduction histidine kinase
MMAQCLEALKMAQFHAKRWLRDRVLPASLVGALLCAGLLFTEMQGKKAAAPGTQNFAQQSVRDPVIRVSLLSHGLPNISLYLLGCSLALPLALWIRRRVRAMRIQSRLAIVKQERERLARELHDTVIQDCTGLSVLLEAMASAAERDEPMPRDLLDCAREQARRTVDDARNAVWNLRRPEMDTDLVAALQDLAAQMTSDGGSSINVRHNVASLPVPASSAAEISMTVREAICNAVRHSGTEKILVDLCSDREGLRVSIQDYGCGLSAAVKPGDSKHFGIVGMRERMQRLGGGLQIDDMPGAGTTVNLMLRWGSVRKSMVWI